VTALKSRYDQVRAFGQKAELFLAKGPAYHFTYGRWRLRRWLNKTFTAADYPADSTLLAQLDLGRPELSQVAEAVHEGQPGQAWASLREYYQTRSWPFFFFNNLADIERIIRLIPPEQRQATCQMADRVCDQIFSFRGEPPVRFVEKIDWLHCPKGNIDWTWDLNRHEYFTAMGRAYWYSQDERYAGKFRELLLDWLAANPPQTPQVNWGSVFEVAFRIKIWIWAYFYFRTAQAFDEEACLGLVKGLLAHGHFLEKNLEYHTRNNHLLLEAKSLAMLGLLFPEFKSARHWQERGLALLFQEVRQQVCADGVHGERALHYHRVVAGELLEILTLLESNHQPIPSDVLERFGRMVEYELWVTKPNGVIPLLADSALEDTHLRFSAARGGPLFLQSDELLVVAPPPDEAIAWLLGAAQRGQSRPPSGKPRGLESRAFAEGGYYIMRHGTTAIEATYLAFDCGPFGYELEPYHGHADALSFELFAYGQTLVVDPGIYSAHLGSAWRLFFRGSRAHNTVVVDHQDQSLLLDTRRIYRPARATLHHWLSNEDFDWVDGAHDGYQRLAKPITHRRQIFFVKPEYWVVVDTLTGQGEHCFDWYFHFMPDTKVVVEEAGSVAQIIAAEATDPALTIASLATGPIQTQVVTGEVDPIQGWVSFYSGEKAPAPTLRFRLQGAAPVKFCTVLYPHRIGSTPSVTVTALALEDEPNPNILLTALQIETADHVDDLLLDQSPTCEIKRFKGYQTKAQLIYLRHKKSSGELIKRIVRNVNQSNLVTPTTIEQ
jgi:hypothetical protein